MQNTKICPLSLKTDASQLFETGRPLLSSLRMVPTGAGVGGRGKGARGARGAGRAGGKLPAAKSEAERKKMGGGETDLFVAPKIKCLERAIDSFSTVKEDFGLCRSNEWGL